MKHKQLSSKYHNIGKMKDDSGEMGITLWFLRLAIQQSTVEYETYQEQAKYKLTGHSEIFPRVA